MAQKPENREKGRNRKRDRRPQARLCLRDCDSSGSDPAYLCVKGQGNLLCNSWKGPSWIIRIVITTDMTRRPEWQGVLSKPVIQMSSRPWVTWVLPHELYRWPCIVHTGHCLIRRDHLWQEQQDPRVKQTSCIQEVEAEIQLLFQQSHVRT